MVCLCLKVLCSFSETSIACQLVGPCLMTCYEIMIRESRVIVHSIQSVGALWGRGHYLPTCVGSCDLQKECSDAWKVNSPGDEAYLVLLRAFTVRISPGIGMSVSFLSNWMSPTGFYLKLSAPGQTHVHVPHHTNFLCPELASYYWKLGSSVQLLAS